LELQINPIPQLLTAQLTVQKLYLSHNNETFN